ncbi:MAG: CDGSH iron-sulfur domain-containing protein [Candidatus Xenobia bacterium]
MSETNIQVMKTGPYIVSGSFTLTDHEGKPIAIEKERIALCRCGASNSKPFCDGTHKTIGFCEKAAEQLGG